MPKSDSNDLRWRVIWRHFLQGKSIGDIAREMYLGKRTIARYIRKFRATGEISPTIQRHGPLPFLSDFEQATILEALLRNPSMYIFKRYKQNLRVLQDLPMTVLQYIGPLGD